MVEGLVEEYMAELFRNEHRQDLEKVYLIKEIKKVYDGNIKEFNKESSKKEVEKETEVGNYPCETCPKIFKNKTTLYNHRSLIHRENSKIWLPALKKGKPFVCFSFYSLIK